MTTLNVMGTRTNFYVAPDEVHDGEEVSRPASSRTVRVRLFDGQARAR
jgi:hypothetical protein